MGCISRLLVFIQDNLPFLIQMSGTVYPHPAFGFFVTSWKIFSLFGHHLRRGYMTSFAVCEFLRYVRRQYHVPAFKLFLKFRYSLSTNLLTAFKLFSIHRYMNSLNPVTAFGLFLLLRYFFLRTVQTCISLRNATVIQRQIIMLPLCEKRKLLLHVNLFVKATTSLNERQYFRSSVFYAIHYKISYTTQRTVGVQFLSLYLA